MTKTCTKCGKEKSTEEFNCQKKGKNGLESQCKSCRAEYGRNWYRANKDRYKRNVEKARISARKWHEKNRFHQALVTSRAVARRRGHFPCDATIKELKTTFTGKCHVCGVPEIECSRRLSMDHNHDIKTDNFRGWLCGNCNRAIGAMKDSPDLILALAEYVERSMEKTE